MKRITLVIAFLSCAFLQAQDTIQGMYSYTYGDNESLVEARQTCKKLALRDAIESYYLFIESSTTVENAQVKEDLIEAIAAGYLSEVQVIEQNESGRTISMTVTATVQGDDVQKLVASHTEKKPADTQPDQERIPDDAVFFYEMDQFESRSESSSLTNEVQDIYTLLKRRRQQMADLEQQKPPRANAFQHAVYQCIGQRMKVQNAVDRLRYYRSRKDVSQIKNQVKTLQELSRILKKHTETLESFQTISEPNRKVRDTWVQRCRETLSQVRQMAAPVKQR